MCQPYDLNVKWFKTHQLMCRFGMDFIYPAPSLCDRMVENENMLSQNKFSKASDDNWIYLNLCSPIHYSGNASRCTMGLLELHNTSYADRRGSNINGLKSYRRRLWQHWEGIYNHGGLYDICTFFYYCVSHETNTLDEPTNLEDCVSFMWCT